MTLIGGAMLSRVAHLHRAGMRAQEQPAFDVEGVVHRAGGMILRLVERGEVVPVGLDLRPVRDVEPDRAEDRLDALPGAHDRMDAAEAAVAPWQRDVERLLRQARIQLRLGQSFAPRDERIFDALFGLIDAAAGDAALLGRQLPQPLERSVSAPDLPR